MQTAQRVGHPTFGSAQDRLKPRPPKERRRADPPYANCAKGRPPAFKPVEITGAYRRSGLYHSRTSTFRTTVNTQTTIASAIVNLWVLAGLPATGESVILRKSNLLSLISQLLNPATVYLFKRITPTATDRRSRSGSFKRAFSAAAFDLNGFESGVNWPSTYLKSSHCSMIFIQKL